MQSNEIRRLFLEYFEKKGHKVLPSASLIPSDPTVLLTLAGMLPFKPIFLGIESPKFKKAATVQKCIRMNDIENVGHTTRHHTFFEMLGNFSFGDYFKEDAIAFAWEVLTKVFKIDPQKLVIAIYEKDDEAGLIWEKKIGIPRDKIYKLDEENNFWAAGATGPCGPCSEIYYDYGKGCGKPGCNPACDCERFLEIWNLVFIQYNRDEAKNLLPLPKKNIDTGMGLERIARVLQGKIDNFDTDLFEPIFKKLPDKSPASKIIADHIRAITYLISDSVMPSNEGRGYVLRRLIRRAVLYSRKLGIGSPFLYDLSSTVIDMGKHVYLDLSSNAKLIKETIRQEEISFNLTLESGMKILDGILEKNQGNSIISGEDAFKLHDTYGFPLEITQEIANERGFNVDTPAFNVLMEEQKEKARSGGQKIEESIARIKEQYEQKHGKTNFIGYDTFECEAKVIDIIPGQNIVILDKSPFYPEGGGQVFDTGIIKDSIVIGTFGEIGGVILHKLEDLKGIKVGEKVKAKIDLPRRKDTTNHHTATHLLQAALRSVVSDSIKQAGSYVGPQRLRFDFTFNRALTKEEIELIETAVNQMIKEKIPVDKFETSFEEAKKLNATALFSEKYGDSVRVVKIGDKSIELCGGCHVNNTQDISFFKIIKEEALQSGVRRIEAVAGEPARIFVVYKAKGLKDQIDDLMRHQCILQAKKELLGGEKFLEADIFNVEQTEILSLTSAINDKDALKVNKFLDHLEGRVELLLERNKNIQKEIASLESKDALKDAEKLLSNTLLKNGINILAAKLNEVSIENLRLIGDMLKDKMKTGIIILASTLSEKVAFLVIITPDVVKKGFNAGKIAKTLSQICGGGGGGRPDKAEAGGRDISKIDEAINTVVASL